MYFNEKSIYTKLANVFYSFDIYRKKKGVKEKAIINTIFNSKTMDHVKHNEIKDESVVKLENVMLEKNSAQI